MAASARFSRLRTAVLSTAVLGAVTALPAAAATSTPASGSLVRTSAPVHIYWSEPENSKGPAGSGIDNIWRANVTGGSINRNFLTGFEVPGALALGSSHIYFNDSESGVMGRARLDGTHRQLDFINQPADAIAVSGGYIYWTGGPDSNRAVFRANLNGSHIRRLFSAGQGTYLGGLAIQQGYIDWTNRDKGTIGRANLDGTHVKRRFIAGLVNPTGLAADSGHLYWASAVQGTGKSSLGRASLSGTAVQKRFITGVGYPFGVAVGGGHLYWADTGAGTIGRAQVNGSHVQPSFIPAQPMFMGSPGAEPFDIAVGP